MTWLGLDFGGANLKLANGLGWACYEPFPLWKQPERLASRLAELVAAAPVATRYVVTMTGELCDCFRTKCDGVRHILAAVAGVVGNADLCVYLVDGQIVPFDDACERPDLAAASNWHALARFACRYLDGGPGLMLDIGSTTTDIVPLAGGQPVPLGTNDTERLMAGELVYSGVGRTPICAIARQLPWRDSLCPVAAELFATTVDAYLLLGDLPEKTEAIWTADGRPLTAQFARERLARMVGADATTFSEADARRAAEVVRQGQIEQLRDAIDRVLSRTSSSPRRVISSGAGEFLVAQLQSIQLSTCQFISLRDVLGETVSACAAAHAVAVLARETAGQ